MREPVLVSPRGEYVATFALASQLASKRRVLSVRLVMREEHAPAILAPREAHGDGLGVCAGGRGEYPRLLRHRPDSKACRSICIALSSLHVSMK
jgi:hypothetical protein